MIGTTDPSVSGRSVLVGPGGVEDFRALLTYIESVGETSADELHELVAALGPQAEEAYVTIADTFRAEGEARGEARGRAETLVRLLTLKFGELPKTRLRLVRSASITQLEGWTERVFPANTLDDVFADPPA